MTIFIIFKKNMWPSAHFHSKILLKDYDFWQFSTHPGYVKGVGKIAKPFKNCTWWSVEMCNYFFKFFQKIDFFKLNNFFKTSESTFPVKNWLFHIFPASEGSPFLTVILTVKLAGLPFLQAEEFTDNFQSDKSCQKYTFLLVLCFSGKSYLVIKVIKNVWLFTCSLRLSW